MDDRLDLADSRSWPACVLDDMAGRLLDSPDDLYTELNHPETDHPLARGLRADMMECIQTRYAGCIAYHSCRPLHPESYLEHGILVTTEDHLRQQAQIWFGDIEGWEEAFPRALNPHGMQHYIDEFFGGKIGLWFTPKPDYTNGSHFMVNMADELDDAGNRRLAEIRVQSKPTHVVCNIPLDWIVGNQTEGDLLGAYACELLRAFISVHHYGNEYTTGSAMHVLTNIPPEQILEIRTYRDGNAQRIGRML